MLRTALFKKENMVGEYGDYEVIVGIYNFKTKSWVKRENPYDISITISEDNINIGDVPDLMVDCNVVEVKIDKYNRIKSIHNDTKYSYDFTVDLPYTYGIDDIVNEYNNDLTILKNVGEQIKNIIHTKIIIDILDTQRDIFNAAMDKLRYLFGIERYYSIVLKTDYYNNYIPTDKDIYKIYDLLEANKDNFDISETLYKIHRDLIQYETVLIEGHYHTNIKNNFKLLYKGDKNEFVYTDFIKKLLSIMPDSCKIDYKSYQKHITVKYNQATCDWLLNDTTNKTKFITEIINIIENQ